MEQYVTGAVIKDLREKKKYAQKELADRILLQKTYPEQDPALRFPRMGFGRLYACCNHHGLFVVKL